MVPCASSVALRDMFLIINLSFLFISSVYLELSSSSCVVSDKSVLSWISRVFAPKSVISTTWVGSSFMVAGSSILHFSWLKLFQEIITSRLIWWLIWARASFSCFAGFISAFPWSNLLSHFLGIAVSPNICTLRSSCLKRLTQGPVWCHHHSLAYFYLQFLLVLVSKHW